MLLCCLEQWRDSMRCLHLPTRSSLVGRAQILLLLYIGVLILCVVRRKYLRQNKDIARVNSNQAVRIRNLELEISRLLAENLELRGQIIRQDHAPQRNKEFVDHVGGIRSQLEAKLREITDMVQTLDRPTRPRRTSINHDPRAKPRTTDERQQLMEALQQQEGRLPGIPEDKPLRFARQTMNEEEINALRRSSDVYNESPDIGPPPVSHLINDTPIKPGFTLPEDTDNDEQAVFEPVVSNIEQRRKRKDTGSSFEMRRGSGFAPLEGIREAKPEAPPMIKPGKRKFTVCDETEERSADRREARAVALVPPSADFPFTRKVSNEKEQTLPAPGPENDVILPPAKKDVATARKAKTTVADAESLSAPPPLTGRRALAPKMSNLDVANSPKKRTARNLTIDEEKSRLLKTKTPRERTSTARSRSRSVDPEAIEAPKTVEVEVSPETPAPADIFSALSTAPSTRPLSRDTPPPGDSTTENFEGARPSRRARASVSYAEPNLRDKMRRPTKELVDAITKSAKQPSEPPTQKVKAEPEDEDAWKSKLPAQAELYSTSPLSIKAAVLGEPPAQDITQRRRRISHQDLDLTMGGSKSGSSIAITELTASGKRAKTDMDRDAIRKSLDLTRKPSAEKDVYDFDDTVELGARPRKTRPIDASAEDGSVDTLVVAKPASSSRRRQSALTTSSSTSSLGEKERILKREGGLQRSSSTNLGNAKVATAAEREDGAAQRVGSRRRSMML